MIETDLIKNNSYSQEMNWGGLSLRVQGVAMFWRRFIGVSLGAPKCAAVQSNVTASTQVRGSPVVQSSGWFYLCWIAAALHASQ